MGIIKKIAIFTMFAAMGGAALSAFPAEKAYAGTYNVSTESVNIDCSTDPEPVISGSSTSNSIVINTASGHPSIVTLSGVNIDLSSGAAAAVSITGNGNVVIVLDGTNTLQSGNEHAGIEKNTDSTCSLEIRGTGSLTATGGEWGAGIGGGQGGAGSNITINGGEVTAYGGSFAAGIGGGQGGAGSNITINGGTVTANGGPIGSGNPGGAGIGGGADGEGSNIKITGGTVIANGAGTDCGGAGIGGGGAPDSYSAGRAGSDIMITGGTVTAAGGGFGAGIGSGGAGSMFSGTSGAGSKITITGGTVTAAGGAAGAGIGGGHKGAGSEIQITGGTVTATGGVSGAGIGGGAYAAGSEIQITGGSVTAAGGVCGAGIGGGFSGTCSDITISNDAEVMAAGGINGDYGEGFNYGKGAAIGNGGDGGENPINGEEVNPDISGLYTTGCIKYYAAGTNAADMNDPNVSPADTKSGTVIPPYTITFDANGGSCDPESLTTKDGKLESLPTPEWEGHTFTRWFTEKDGGTEVTTSTVFTSDATVYAHWEENPAPATYTITFDPNGGTVSSGSAATGTDGKLTSLPTPEWEGHTFTGWFTEKDGGTEVTTSTVFTSDATVYAHWEENPEPDTPKEAVITVSDNKPMAVSTESKGEFNITYAHEIPFFGKGKITPEYFGGLTVSQGNATYTATKIKANKKKLRIQITGLSGADKDAVKKIKKATKGSNGLPFKCNPYYVRDTDKATPKFNKKGELKSVKILINNKDYKAKKDEFSYDIGTKQILFKGSNLSGSYQTR